MATEETDRAQFDEGAFFAALDRARESRGINWRQVSVQAGVSQSTLTRISHGRRPDVDSLALLVDWAGLDANAFIRRARASDEPVADPLSRLTAHLRAERSLSPEVSRALESVVAATYRAITERDGHAAP